MKAILHLLPRPIRQRIAAWRLERIRRANAESYETRRYREKRKAALKGLGRG